MTSCFPRRRRRLLGYLFSFRGGKKESFRSLVRKQAFNRIRYRLEDKRFLTENMEWLYEEMNHQTPLHFILPHRPPVAVVNLILEYTNGECHVPEEALDLEGRTPLHIAAAHNCSFDVMERLLSGVSLVVPALTKDNMGRCPLHWACCYRSLPGRSESDNKFDTILLLLDAYPQAVVVADNNGKTPLDYASYRVLDQRIMDVLERATKKQKESGNKLKRKTKKSAQALGGTQNLSDSYSVESGIPCEVNGSTPGVSRFFLARYLFQNNDDDVSSIGLDRSITPSGSIDSVRSPASKSTIQMSSKGALPGLNEEGPEAEPRGLLEPSYFTGSFLGRKSPEQDSSKTEKKERSGSTNIRSTSLFSENLQQPPQLQRKLTDPTAEG